MKRKTYSFFILFTIIILSATKVWGQEKKNSFTISGVFAHYIKIEEQNFEPFTPPDGYYNFPISPGLEINYSRVLTRGIELETGINFQKVHFSSFVDYIRRFRYNEISIPLTLKKTILFSNSNYLTFSSGVYFGTQNNIESDYPTSFAWDEWNDLTTIEGYSDDSFFTDFYFDTGYALQLIPNNYLVLSPFLKYRFNSTWLNHHQNRFHFGIKINYSFKF
jgi:hypothetical protein